MKTVYIHIGTMKTGTSAIQNFLYENKAVLEKHGCGYPVLDIGLNRYLYRNAHFLIWAAPEKDPQKKRALEKALHEKAYQQIAAYAGPYNKLVITEESIWHRCDLFPDFWSDLVEDFRKLGFQVKIIVYLRRQDSVVQSLWNQRVKMEGMVTADFKQCIEQNGLKWFEFDYYKQLQKITQYVGKENMIVRVYEKGQFEGNNHSIYSDFLQCMDLPLTDEYTNKKESTYGNLGLTGNFIEIKRRLNKVPQYRELQDFMMKPIMRASNYMDTVDPVPRTSMFSYDEQLAFLAKYEESNQKVAQEFLNRTDAPLFWESVKQLPEWKPNTNTIYRDLFISSCMVFCDQERKIRNLQKQLDDTKREMNALRKTAHSMQNTVNTLHPKVVAMHNSLIFRMYRKLRKILKHE